MKRKIYDELINWKKEECGRTAMLIDGARRVGKSIQQKNLQKMNTKVTF